MRYHRLAIAAVMVAAPIATLIPASASTSCASAAGTSIADCSFEDNALAPGTIDYGWRAGGFPGSAWTFGTASNAYAGLENGNPWGGPAPTVGSQAAFVQYYTGAGVNGPGSGAISQSISGWDGVSMYALTLDAVTRPCCDPVAAAPASVFEVQIDGVPVSAAQTVPNSTTWTTYSYSFSVPAGTHMLSIVALPGNTDDTTTFLDNIRLTRPYTASSCKDNGWQTIPGFTFKNQGDCVSYYATGGKNLPRG
jgi:hypothetical protein